MATTQTVREKSNSKGTLLERAKATAPREMKETSAEEMELALGWLRGEITLSQVAYALGAKKSNSTMAYSMLCRALRGAFAQGYLVDNTQGE